MHLDPKASTVEPTPDQLLAALLMALVAMPDHKFSFSQVHGNALYETWLQRPGFYKIKSRLSDDGDVVTISLETKEAD